MSKNTTRYNREAMRRWRAKYPERARAIRRAAHEKFKREKPCRFRYNKQKYRNRLKTAAMDAYGGPRCNCCGLEDETLLFLSIDHVDGNGCQHRRSDPSSGNLCSWLKKHDYPPGFQVLCHNCNFAKGLAGICPHQLMTRP